MSNTYGSPVGFDLLPLGLFEAYVSETQNALTAFFAHGDLVVQVATAVAAETAEIENVRTIEIDGILASLAPIG